MSKLRHSWMWIKFRRWEVNESCQIGKYISTINNYFVRFVQTHQRVFFDDILRVVGVPLWVRQVIRVHVTRPAVRVIPLPRFTAPLHLRLFTGHSRHVSGGLPDANPFVRLTVTGGGKKWKKSMRIIKKI